MAPARAIIVPRQGSTRTNLTPEGHMLDVHSPTTFGHTWRDFLLHIATIVVGLLIALSLEQLVEHVHQRHEIRDARESLQEERLRNRKAFRINTRAFQDQAAILKNNYLVLSYFRAHPKTTEELLPGVLIWGGPYSPAKESAWKTAQQTGATALLPPPEVMDRDALYRYLEAADSAAITLWISVSKAQQYSFTDPNITHLTTQEVDEELRMTKEAMGANIRWGFALHDIHRDYPEFDPAPTSQELAALESAGRSDSSNPRLALPSSLTTGRRRETKAALNAAMDETP
jgi:hypothetical protein